MAKPGSKNQQLPPPLPPAGSQTATPLAAPTPPAPAAPSSTKAPERNFGGTREVVVDRFKLSLDKCAKNRALKVGGVEIQHLEHRHFWDSKDRRGKDTTHTEFMCGHKHAITYERGANGEIKLETLKCSPALMETVSKMGNGRKITRLTPVNFGQDPNSSEVREVLDVHTHEVEYMKSEKMVINI